MNRHDRYIRIATWARNRYTVAGRVPVTRGGEPLPYRRIDDAAAVKYLGCDPAKICAAYANGWRPFARGMRATASRA